MHFIVGPETLDSVTETGNCTYKPTSMAMDAPGAPFVSPNVLVNKAPLSFYSSMGHMPGTVTPIKKVLIDPRPCIPGVRTKLVAVQGDKISITTDAGPAPRQILGPYQHLNVMIESPMNDTTL